MNAFRHAATPALAITGFCWLIFAIFWLLASVNVKRTTERWSPATGFAYLLWSALVYNLLFRTEILSRTPLIPHTPGSSALAILASVTGLVITLWARVALGRNWSGSITHKEEHELVEHGPYRFVRHPIYTGMILLVVGSAVARGTADALAAIVVFIAVHLWKLRQEETLMTRYFPDTYPEYRTRTKALFPLLY